jgi:S-adenosylmethionine:tRNA ribosyltransferase-isomerase
VFEARIPTPISLFKLTAYKKSQATGLKCPQMNLNHTLTLADFDYNLPAELIAQSPAATRRSSRLLHINEQGTRADLAFTDLPALLRPNDLLIFNDTRVIKARLFGQKTTGGKVEVLIERITTTHQALAHVRSSKSPIAGSMLRLAQALDVKVLGRADDLFILEFQEPVLDMLERYGAIPLPPYITHAPDAEDDQRYQTVYARAPGAVAAPTAGLHFDDAMLEQLRQMGVSTAFVTLHVGAGTFQPVRAERLEEHIMHAEWYTVPLAATQAIARARATGGRVIAVGTTSVRALESAAKAQLESSPVSRPPTGQRLELTPHSGDTRLFITPGYTYQVVDAMVTNFHLPQSTLLMLVAAFIGLDTMQAAYAHAIKERYRFFSYGDAMFLERNQTH